MRYAIFHALMRLKRPFSSAARKRRMRQFIDRMGITGGERIIDLGGAPGFWDDCPLALDITIVNLPGFNPETAPPSHHALHLRVGDACNVDFAGDMSFDIAFSNSVIEHVGDATKQAEMAREVRRLAPAYWVQTPSIWFPVEAHNHMPFWWFYPAPLKRVFIRRWRAKLPAWTEMVETTTVLLRSQLQRLFPDGTIWTERKFGLPKSYVVYKRGERAEREERR
ncbi:methyltransferase domain-containing protein [Roseovarius salis]|uniref:class I SAM-dependent methyltransferase n=1 Tax=Roseovarius salis TaxID=3376063 RepID=UPI0037C76279